MYYDDDDTIRDTTPVFTHELMEDNQRLRTERLVYATVAVVEFFILAGILLW